MQKLLSVRGIVFSALFAALLALSSYLNVPLGFTSIPISLENLVVMLAGAILGPLYGFLSMLLVVVLTAAGVPLLHGSGGISVLLGATGGFVWAYPFAALFIGFFVRRLKGKGPLYFIATFITMELFGSLLLYLTGIPWLAHVAHYSFHKAMAAGCYPFLLGDAIKAVLAAIIIVPVRKVYPYSKIIGSHLTR